MTEPTNPKPPDPSAAAVSGPDAVNSSEQAFEQASARAAGRSSGPLAEFGYFLRRTRKWWMAPIIAMLLLIGALLVMAGTAVAPLIYALF